MREGRGQTTEGGTSRRERFWSEGTLEKRGGKVKHCRFWGKIPFQLRRPLMSSSLSASPSGMSFASAVTSCSSG